MKFDSCTQRIGVVLLLVTFGALLGCGGANGDSVQVSETRSDGEDLSSDDKAAAEFVRGKIDEFWVKGAEGWITQFQQLNVFGQVMPDRQPNTLFKQYRTIAFTIGPDTITEAMKLNGTDYRGVAKFKDSPVRFYQLEATFEGPQGWSNWREDPLGYEALAVERRNGKWLISGSANFFDGVKPDPASIPPNS